MRNILTCILVVLMVTGLALTAQALPVYDAAGNLAAFATAEATGPVSGIESGVPQVIKIFAHVPQSLRVNLSATQIDWQIKKSGTYQTPAITINATTTVSGPVTMTVAGAADLAKSTNKISTFYALKPSGGTGVPASYTAAGSFNGAHTITNLAGTDLWNKLVVAAGKPAGDYKNEFSVTFSQAL